MTIKNDLTSLLAAAQDPTTDPGELVRVWNSTTSSRVRKAVAGNPNCSTEVMCMASRLYIKEVVENPSFELKNLFSEDPVVKEIYTAYTDPGDFWARKITVSKAKAPVNRALLVSPQLSSWKILECLSRSLGSAEFLRELKDGDVKTRVCGIARKNLDHFSISTLVFFINNGIISINDFSKTLNSRKVGEVSLPKKAYCETFKTIRDKTDYFTLLKFVMASSNYSLKHLVKSIKDKEMSDYLFTDQCLVDLSNLYRDVLAQEIRWGREHYGKNSTWYWAKLSYNDNKQSHYLANLIWSGISARNELTLANLDLERLFSDIKMVGFDKDYGPYKSRVRFKELDLLTGRNDLCQKLLDLRDDEAFEYFMTCGFLWDTWYAKGGEYNLETRVVDRMHALNERRGGKYYSHSSLSDYYPSIEIQNSNGINHNSDMYFDAKNTTVPPGSGLLPPKVR